MNRPRFFTTSLAAAAVAATLTFVAPPANAADTDPQCGLPASTVQHEAETHTAWLWERTETTPGFTRFDFTRTNREYSYTDYTWTRWMITQPATEGSPAVPPTYEEELEWERFDQDETETTDWLREAPEGDGWTQIEEKTVTDKDAVTEETYLYGFRQPNSGQTRLEPDPNWNTNGGQHKGWERAPDLDEVEETVITPAETHEEFRYQRTIPGQRRTEWSVDSPGAGWTATGEVRQGSLIDEGQPAVDPTPEQGDWVEGTTTDPNTPPDNQDWELIDQTEYTQWAYVAPEAPWQPTGEAKSAETRSTRSAEEQPAGEGWTLAGSEDVPASTRVVRSKVHSAAAPDAKHQWSKVAGSAQDVVDKEAWTENIPGTKDCDQIAAPAAGQDGNSTDQVASPQAAPAVTTGVLPNTGSSVSIGIAAAGLGSLAAGAVLMMLSRRNRFGVN